MDTIRFGYRMFVGLAIAGVLTFAARGFAPQTLLRPSWGAAGAPPAPPAVREPAPIEEVVVNGTERLAWDQLAFSPGVLAGLAFVAYIDNVPSNLNDVRCTPLAGPDGFECQAAIPPLTPGSHTLEVAAYEVPERQIAGPRSRSLIIRLK